MAYFPNGTAGEIFNDQCHECLHGAADDFLCPVAHIQMIYNYTQLDDGNEDLRAAMCLLVQLDGTCQMKLAMEKAGIKIDFSGRDQMELPTY
jgi:hypothetical protein